jgi:hypothetical protein
LYAECKERGGAGSHRRRHCGSRLGRSPAACLCRRKARSASVAIQNPGTLAMGKFFLVIAISIALVLGAAVVLTYF